MKRGLGYNDCPVDARGTHSIEEVLGASAVSPPDTLDLTMLVKRIRDQDASGTCVGFGSTQALMSCAMQNGYPEIEELSALGGYIQARAIEGALKDPKDGTTLSAAMEGYQRGGFLYEKDFPYVQSKRFDGLPLGQGQKGLKRGEVKSHRLQEMSLAEFKSLVKTLLASGKGMAGGWRIDDPFRLWTPGQPLWPGLRETSLGGHCMAIHDFPDGNPRLVNSWGEDEGDKGFWTVTWEALHGATAIWAVDFVPYI